MATLYTVTIDTEEEWDWSAGFPTQEPSVTNIRELPRFQELCTRNGASVTYFTDHAVLTNPEAAGTLLNIAEQPNVEIGMHIHPWNTPPVKRNGAVKVRESFLRNLPEDLIRDKLESVYEQFIIAGIKPTSFRGGRYSSGGAIHEFLRNKSFLADASVVPFTTWPDDGAPDYRHRDLQPVRLPPRRDGEQPLWEIPLTLAFSRGPQHLWRRAFEIIETTPLSRLRLIGIAQRLRLVERIWLNFECPLGANMVALLNKLRYWNLPCICFTLHSSSLMPGGNTFTRSTAERDRLFAQLQEVLQLVAGWDDFHPATVTQVAEHLEREYHHESSRN